MEVWNKFNPRERMVGLGAAIVIVGWILSLVGSFGLGSNIIALLGAIAALVVLYLKYAPNQNIAWPAPVPLILLGISGITALLAAVTLLQWVSILGAFAGFLGVGLVSVVVTAIGAGLMVWGSWQEYQVAPKTPGTPSAGSGYSSAPPPPPAAPPPPPAQTARPDEDDLPPV